MTEHSPGGPLSHCNGVFPRTGACISADGHILYLIATGEATPYNTWTGFMRDYAMCDDGMDFDSNSSTTMVWDGQEMVPHDHQAAIGTGLLVYDTHAELAPGVSKNDFESRVFSGMAGADDGD